MGANRVITWPPPGLNARDFNPKLGRTEGPDPDQPTHGFDSGMPAMPSASATPKVSGPSGSTNAIRLSVSPVSRPGYAPSPRRIRRSVADRGEEVLKPWPRRRTLFASAPSPRPRQRRFRRLSGFGRRSGRRASVSTLLLPHGDYKARWRRSLKAGVCAAPSASDSRARSTVVVLLLAHCRALPRAHLSSRNVATRSAVGCHDCERGRSRHDVDVRIRRPRRLHRLTEAHGGERAAEAAAAFCRELRVLLGDYGAEEVNAVSDALIVRDLRRGTGA
jgi:hypothetical protein